MSAIQASIDDAQHFDTNEKLRSYEEFRSWFLRVRPSIERAEEFAARIKHDGFIDPLTERWVSSELITYEPGQARESLVYEWVNSRQRAVMHLIRLATLDRNPAEYRIYASEAITGFALAMRGVFARFIGSEYLPGPAVREWMYPIQHQDLMSLSFADGIFDIVTTNEVMEHIPDIDAALSEIHRVLLPGGRHIGTVPFDHGAPVGKVRSILKNGEIKHLLPPEIHGDPLSESGSLVFETPGWDILDRARSAGFSDAYMHLVASAKHGYVGPVGGIFVMVLVK